MLRKVQIIINPTAGPDLPVVRILHQALSNSALDWQAVVAATPSDVTHYIDVALRTDVDAIALYGGDGTIMEAAPQLALQSIPLVILPGGTANILAKELQIPIELEKAAQILLKKDPEIINLDLGKCGQEVFVLRMNLGLPADMVKSTSRERKDIFGPLAYSLSALEHAFSTATQKTFHLTLDGQQYTEEGVGLMVTNVGNFGIPGVPLLSNVSPTDGKLDVLLFTASDLPAVLALAKSTFTRKPHPTLKHWSVQTATISTKPPVTVVRDDKVVPYHPLEISVIPKALKIMR